MKSPSFVNEIFRPRTKVLNVIFDKCKTHNDKRCLGYVNKVETVEKLFLLKAKII